MMNTHESGSEYIKREIMKTGYPLELEIYSLLKSNPKWYPNAKAYFLDEEERKGRSIDIYAFESPTLDAEYNIIKPPIDPLNFDLRLAIECKKSNRNWIFFPIEEDFASIDGQGISFMEDQNGSSLIFYFSISGFEHYNPFKNKIASNYTILKEGKDEILEASMQLIKYITYSKYKRMEILSGIDNSLYQITFWFPIIVFDGELWNVFLEEGKVKEVIESKHTILRNTYRPIHSINEANFVIDVVHRSYFEEFLGIINKDIDGLINSLLADNNKSLNYILETYKWDSRRRGLR